MEWLGSHAEFQDPARALASKVVSMLVPAGVDVHRMDFLQIANTPDGQAVEYSL